MRLFTLTSPAFSGEAEMLFDETGRLIRFDVSKTNMPVAMVDKFKARIPADAEGLKDAFAGSKAMIVEKDYEVSFDMFWTEYKKKINKDRCEALWKNMSKADQVQAYHGIAGYDKFLAQLEWRKKADPETYLKKKMYKNDWKEA